MCVAVLVGLAKELPVIAVVSLALGIIFFSVRSVVSVVRLVTGFDPSDSAVGTVASSGWQIVTDILWFLTAFPLLVCWALAPVFVIFSRDPEIENNRIALFFVWLVFICLGVLWNITPEARQVTFGPLYRFVSLFY